MFATRTGNTCDETLNNNVAGGSRAVRRREPLREQQRRSRAERAVVRGNLDVDNNASIGASSSMSTRTETTSATWCHYGEGHDANPCTGNQDANNIFSKKNPPNYVVGVNNNPTRFSGADRPTFPAGTRTRSRARRSRARRGRLPALLRSSTRTTRAGQQRLDRRSTSPRRSSLHAAAVGASSGTRRRAVSSPGTQRTKTLSVNGTIFIDGSAKVTNGAPTHTTARRRSTSPARSSSTG